jgi:cell division protein FtsB
MISIRIAGGWLYAMRRVLATLCIAVLTVLIGYKVVFGANGMNIWQAKRAEAEQLQMEIEKKNAEHEQLQHRVDELQRGAPSVIEKEAREQLGYVKPGDHVLYEPQAKSELRPAAPVADDQLTSTK